MSSWKASAQQLSEILQSRSRNESVILQLLDTLNTLVYPIENLRSEDVESLVRCFVGCSGGQYDGEFKVQVAKLTYSLLTYQKATVEPDLLAKLLHFFLSSLATTHPPDELLYVSAIIVNLGISPEEPNSLLDERKPLFKMALISLYSVETQRAALDLLLAVVDKVDLSRTVLLRVLESLLQSINSAECADTDDPLLINKLLLSRLRLLHTLLPLLPPFPSLPLLLTTLKANMAMGLPGQAKATPTTIAAAIQPPLTIPQPPPPQQQQEYQPSPKSGRPMHSVAGPQERKGQGKGARRNHSKAKAKQRRDTTTSGTGSDHSSHQSSDSESSSSSSEVSLSRWSVQPSADSSSSLQKGRSWRRRGKGISSSEGEVSDSDTGSTKFKTVLSKIRHQALSCLAVIFQVVDHHTAFSYWLSFLPDGPRPPNSPPLLLTCLLKDPVPRCRGAAVSVLCAMLDGSKSYLAIADDSPRGSQPFTSYSVTVGCVVRELHRGLLLALTAEPNSTTLTQIIKALALLVANSPYHQLSEGYIGRVTATLGKLSNHRDVNVQVSCLTCYGAVISISPSHREVERWLASPGHPAIAPWLLKHCISIFQLQSSLALQTEALQIMAALSKFYFPQISSCWVQLKDFYLSHLASLPRRVQQHVLKMLEELCRALASSVSADVGVFWEELLGGPLMAVLQDYSERGALSAQAYGVLATMSPHSMATMKVPFRMLALTLPLGLCKDDNAPSAVIASAVRVLGVFILFEALREDENFFLDCQSAISHCLGSTAMAVRVQAAWALANLMDSFSSLHQPSLLLPAMLLTLCEAVHCTLKDGDKVKCNGVRAAGILLKQLPEQSVSTCKAMIDEICVQLCKCVTSGSMKSRWNACYACHSAFSNAVFTVEFPTNVAQLVTTLCSAVQNCKNFKVRSNAGVALCSAVMHNALAGQQFKEVWDALSQALENSDQQMDFSEFKHAVTLKSQLCTGICHLLAALPSDGAIPLLPAGEEIKESSRKHLSHFLSRACALGEDGERQDSKELAERVRRNLECVLKQGSSQDRGLKQLLDMFASILDELVPTRAF